MAGTPSDIIKIGNSQGLRIPKSLLQQTALNGPVELDVLDGQLLIRPVGELPAVNQSSASIGLKVVTVGGGTGGFMLLSALRHYANNITAIVNMSDMVGLLAFCEMNWEFFLQEISVNASLLSLLPQSICESS